MDAREVKWEDLLRQATEEPGTVAEAYQTFWTYSVGNQMLALFQCMERGIESGPLNTYKGWQKLGRHVCRGEKAIVLCMPVTGRKVRETEDGEEEEEFFTRFVYKPMWFVLSQTEGADYVPEPLPGWDPEAAMKALGVKRVPFKSLDGNVQGYAMPGKVAINPVADHPNRTLAHELAHIVLGHCADGKAEDGATIERSEREMEAEGAAMLVADALGLGGVEESRGYIQSWYGAGNQITERNARRIMHAADTILRAGQGRLDKPPAQV